MCCGFHNKLLHALLGVVGFVARSESYYDVLGLSQHATARDIKRAYRRLALKWHPDKNEDARASDRFRLITEAYQILSDPLEKLRYDSIGNSDIDSLRFDYSSARARDIFNAFFADKDLFGVFARMQFQQPGKAFTRSSPRAHHKKSKPASTASESGRQCSTRQDSACVSNDEPIQFETETTSDEASASEHLTDMGDEDDPDGCFDVQVLEDIEPRDGTIKHVFGSACCNEAPQQQPTTLLGCCQRCAQSHECEIFNWDPRGGTCWLVRLNGGPLETDAATDRKMGFRPWEVGDESDLEGCFNARIQKDMEPKDGTVKHALGSACCNPMPQRKPVDLLGCCQRCVNSPQCDIFNWKPSTGTCWLLYYLGSSRETIEVKDRNLGNSPAHALA